MWIESHTRWGIGIDPCPHDEEDHYPLWPGQATKYVFDGWVILESKDHEFDLFQDSVLNCNNCALARYREWYSDDYGVDYRSWEGDGQTNWQDSRERSGSWSTGYGNHLNAQAVFKPTTPPGEPMELDVHITVDVDRTETAPNIGAGMDEAGRLRLRNGELWGDNMAVHLYFRIRCR